MCSKPCPLILTKCFSTHTQLTIPKRVLAIFNFFWECLIHIQLGWQNNFMSYERFFLFHIKKCLPNIYFHAVKKCASYIYQLKELTNNARILLTISAFLFFRKLKLNNFSTFLIIYKKYLYDFLLDSLFWILLWTPLPWPDPSQSILKRRDFMMTQLKSWKSWLS